VTPEEKQQRAPVYPVPLRDSEELTFHEAFRIKAATGVDVYDPPAYAHMIAACLWFEARAWPEPLTWEEAQTWGLRDVDLSRGEESLPEDELTREAVEEADPTRGSGTPSNA